LGSGISVCTAVVPPLGSASTKMKLLLWIGVLCLACFARSGVAVSIRGGGRISASDPSDSAVLFKLLNAALAEREGAQLEGFSGVDPKKFKDKTGTVLSVVTNLLEQVKVANNKTQLELNQAAEGIGSKCSHPDDASKKTKSEPLSLLQESSGLVPAEGTEPSTSLSGVTAQDVKKTEAAATQCNAAKKTYCSEGVFL